LSARKSKRPRNSNDVWLGSQREKEIGWLQERMKESSDGKQRVRLAREARVLRHGSDIIRESQQYDFGSALRGVKLPACH
jgi:hypothetical protein